jgi:hypothetical protein
MDEEKQKFTRDDPTNMFYICTRIENGMGCQKLGLKVH